MLQVKDSNSTTKLVPQMSRPRPIEKDSDSSDVELYVDYLPPSPPSQSPPIDAQHFKDRVDPTTNLEGKQRRISRVSFSDAIQIISSDDEREDEIKSCVKDLKENCGLKEGSVGGLKFEEKYSNPSEVPADYKYINENAISAISTPLKSPKPKPVISRMGFPTLLRKEFQNVLMKDQIKSSPIDLEANGGPMKDFPGNNFGVRNQSLPLNRPSDVPPEADSVVPPDYKYIEGSTIFKTSITPKSVIPKLAKSEMGSPTLFGKELQNVLVEDQIESSLSDLAENCASKKGFSGNYFKMENQLPQPHPKSEHKLSNSFDTPQEADSEAPPVYKHIFDGTTFAPHLPPGSSKSPKSKLPKSGMGFPTMLRNEFQNALAEKGEVHTKTSHNKKRTNLVHVFKKPSEPPALPPKSMRNSEIIAGAEQIEITDSVAETEETSSPIHLLAETPIASLTQELVSNNMPQCSPDESRLQRYPNEEPKFEEAVHSSYHVTEIEKELNIAMNDLYNSEKNYINRLQAGLQIRDELRAVRISEETLDKFFGFLEDVLIFHETLFLPDLCNKSQTTKNILLSFLKHFITIDIYIKRQWMIPYESDLDQFELSLVDRKNLKQYLDITKGRVKEYIKRLQFLKANCMEQESENIEIVERALRVMENLLYQLEMVDQFKKIEDKTGIFKACGRVYLNCLFEASCNRNKNYIYLVYLCENSVIITSVQDRTYRYIDDLPISNMYCITRKNKPKRFEIGIKNEKNYNLKANTEAVRDHWCDKLRTMLRFDHFCEK